MRRLQLTRTFERDFNEAYRYIGERDFAAATRFRRTVNEAIRSIHQMPTRGSERSDLPPGLRALQLRPYSVIYRFDDTAVWIVRLIHNAQDFRELF